MTTTTTTTPTAATTTTTTTAATLFTSTTRAWSERLSDWLFPLCFDSQLSPSKASDKKNLGTDLLGNVETSISKNAETLEKDSFFKTPKLVENKKNVSLKNTWNLKHVEKPSSVRVNTFEWSQCNENTTQPSFHVFSTFLFSIIHMQFYPGSGKKFWLYTKPMILFT